MASSFASSTWPRRLSSRLNSSSDSSSLITRHPSRPSHQQAQVDCTRPGANFRRSICDRPAGSTHGSRAHWEQPPCRKRTRQALSPCGKPLSSPGGRAVSPIDLLSKERDGPLIDRSGIPASDRGKIGFAGLIARARTSAVTPEEVRRRGKRVGGVAEASSGTIVEDALGHELSLADLAVDG